MDTAKIAELRSMTNAGVADCKKALDQAEGDLCKASQILKQKGLSLIDCRSGRELKETRVFSYTHSNGKIGALVEIGCETDFVAKTDEFMEFGKNVVLQIAAMNPNWVSEDEMAPAILSLQREVIAGELGKVDKPQDVIKMIIEGKLAKWRKEVILLEQSFIKDDKKTIHELLGELITKVGENCKIKRFVRFGG